MGRDAQCLAFTLLSTSPLISFPFDGRRSCRIVSAMDSTNRDAVDELLQTYSETGGINYLDAAATLPSRLAIEAACAELMSLMFPGFRSEALVSSEDLADTTRIRSEEHTSELQSPYDLVCRLLLEKKKTTITAGYRTLRRCYQTK